MRVCGLQVRCDTKPDIFGVHFLGLAEPGSRDHFLLVNRSALGSVFPSWYPSWYHRQASLVVNAASLWGWGTSPTRPLNSFSRSSHLLPPRWRRGGPCINCSHHNSSVTLKAQQLRGSSRTHSHKRHRPPEPPASLTFQLCVSKFPTVNPLANPSSIGSNSICPDAQARDGCQL